MKAQSKWYKGYLKQGFLLVNYKSNEIYANIMLTSMER